MSIRRRDWIAGMMSTAAAPGNSTDPASARADFPWASQETYLNAATEHPLALDTSRAMQEYLHALSYGPDSARDKYENGRLMIEVKKMFARLINAGPSE